ncbi:MAG: anaerobic ribonucleoside-triphosphate reductase, partial [Lachnospiraceae bacterium]|nr:anaerobic ribonucleoside-triphosphate reductase [Lachnospiraceae bacterium]
METKNRTNVIKRNGREVDFCEDKIVHAIEKANNEVDGIHQMNDYQIKAVANKITKQVAASTHAVNVEDIQDMVETGIMEMRCYEVAQKYVRYRYKRELSRKSNTTDNGILALIDQLNEEVKQENSNKNPVINSTQRDYMAGEVSKDLTKRILLPEEIIKAHEEGIIHFHDSDYFAMREHNCDLINLEDMLQNGTVISETLIERPHSFFTACNVTTQIVAQVASNQYGGQSFTLAHLAPFVDVSRQKIRKLVIEERKECGEDLNDEIIDKITEKRLLSEVKSGIQTIQYQLITLMTCNGQAPFVTMFMYLDEVEDGQIRDDLALIIQEVMIQRMAGVKNEKGVWVTPAFPKLIYVLDEDNIHEDSKYYYLTELAAKCTAKRMVPDYISAKIMKELKQGNVYTCMGCRSFLTVEESQKNPDGSHKFYGRFNQGVVTINLVDVACSSYGDM